MTPAATATRRRADSSVAPRRRPSTQPRPAERRPPLKVVRPETLGRLRPGRVGTIAGLLLFAVLFGLVAFQTVLIGAQARVDEMQQRVEAQEEVNRDLSLTMADLRSPERVTTAAKERLGMVEPGSVTFLRSSSDEAVATSP